MNIELDIKLFISLIALFISLLAGFSSFFHIKFQAKQNKIDIEKLEKEVTELRLQIDKSLSKVYSKIDNSINRVVDKLDEIKHNFVSHSTCEVTREGKVK